MSYVRDAEQVIMEEDELQNYGGLFVLGLPHTPCHWCVGSVLALLLSCLRQVGHLN